MHNQKEDIQNISYKHIFGNSKKAALYSMPFFLINEQLWHATFYWIIH